MERDVSGGWIGTATEGGRAGGEGRRSRGVRTGLGLHVSLAGGDLEGGDLWGGRTVGNVRRCNIDIGSGDTAGAAQALEGRRAWRLKRPQRRASALCAPSAFPLNLHWSRSAGQARGRTRQPSAGGVSQKAWRCSRAGTLAGRAQKRVNANIPRPMRERTASRRSRPGRRRRGRRGRCARQRRRCVEMGARAVSSDFTECGSYA